MRLNIYSIFDVASKAYTRPFFLMTDVQAIRSFTDIATDREHEVGKHPEDYSVVRIGIWDDQDASLLAEDRRVLATGLEVVASSREPDAAKQRDLLEEIKMNGQDERLGQ